MTRHAPADGREWILAIRLRQLGDVLATLSVLRALRDHGSGRAIAYVVDAPYARLLREVPWIDRTLVPPASRSARAWVHFLRALRALGASATIDFHGSVRSAVMTVASGARVRVGFDVRLRKRAYTIVEPRGEWIDGRRVPHNPIVWGMRLARHVGAAAAEDLPPALPCGPGAAQRAGARMMEHGVGREALARGRLVGLNPGRPSPTKSWAVSQFVELARRLASSRCGVVVLWGPGEEGVAREIVRAAGSGVALAPGFALEEMPAAVSNLAALVTIDSGLKHLAVCARVPTVTVFGSTDPREWHMGTPRDHVLWRGLSCSPCRRVACPFGTPCMDIDVDAVHSRVLQVLGATA